MDDMLNSLQYTITVMDVYKKKVTIPDGYEFVAFRIPKKGDLILTLLGLVIELTASAALSGPRIVVKKKKVKVIIKSNVEQSDINWTVGDIYPGDVEIPEGYDFVDFRNPMTGELVVSELTNLVYEQPWVANRSNRPKIIVREKLVKT